MRSFWGSACTQAMVDRLEATEEYEDVNNSNNPVELLKLIRSCIYQKHVTKKPVHAFIDAEYALLTLRQESNQSLSSYYKKFKEVVQVYQNLGSGPGASDDCVSETLLHRTPIFQQELLLRNSLRPYLCFTVTSPNTLL